MVTDIDMFCAGMVIVVDGDNQLRAPVRSTGKRSHNFAWLGWAGLGWAGLG